MQDDDASKSQVCYSFSININWLLGYAVTGILLSWFGSAWGDSNYKSIQSSTDWSPSSYAETFLYGVGLVSIIMTPPPKGAVSKWIVWWVEQLIG